jgi:hypothetical protein
VERRVRNLSVERDEFVGGEPGRPFRIRLQQFFGDEAIPAAPSAGGVLEHERHHQFGHGRDTERTAGWHDRQRVDWPTLSRRHTEVPDATIAAAVSASSNLFSEIIFGMLYGFVSVCAAVPLAFAINVTRHWI